MIEFTDRVPAEGKENRYKITKSDGTSEYVTIERADDANPVGTPLNKSTFETMQTELMPVIGTYTGNGEENGTSQTIELGFTPQCVIVFCKSIFISGSYNMFGMAIKEMPMTADDYNLLEIVDNGFSVLHQYTNSRRSDLNDNNSEYIYIAFR